MSVGGSGPPVNNGQMNSYKHHFIIISIQYIQAYGGLLNLKMLIITHMAHDVMCAMENVNKYFYCINYYKVLCLCCLGQYYNGHTCSVEADFISVGTQFIVCHACIRTIVGLIRVIHCQL